jgi:tetratricopeptide (TPR) repeat protein
MKVHTFGMVILSAALCTSAYGATKAAKKGDTPQANRAVSPMSSPPGAAMQLSVREAVDQITDAIQNAYTGKLEFGVAFLEAKYEMVPPVVKFASPALIVYQQDMEGRGPLTAPFHGDIHIDFHGFSSYLSVLATKQDKVLHMHPKNLFETDYNYVHQTGQSFYIFWVKESDAQRFVDAANRLIYAARTGYTEPSEWQSFRAQADAWRKSNPSPNLPLDADRERILAESAIADKKPDLAVQHYEAALAVDSMWPAGWYNAAIIYGELGDYRLAADRMQHYLVLAPDAPDAHAAYEHLVIWQDKADRAATPTAPPNKEAK